eukprot:4089305-Prymnesium_polylepis.2
MGRVRDASAKCEVLGQRAFGASVKGELCAQVRVFGVRAGVATHLEGCRQLFEGKRAAAVGVDRLEVLVGREQRRVLLLVGGALDPRQRQRRRARLLEDLRLRLEHLDKLEERDAAVAVGVDCGARSEA